MTAHISVAARAAGLAVSGRQILSRFYRSDFRLVPRDGISDARMCVRILVRRLTPLYVYLLLVVWGATIVFWETASTLQSRVMPVVFSVLIAWRLRHWQRVITTASAANIRATINTLQWIGPLLGCAITVWLATLDSVAKGSQQDFAHIATAVSGVIAVLCLGTTPFTATLVALSVVVPSSLFYLATQHPHADAIIAGQAALVLLTVWMSVSFQHDFVRLVIARRMTTRHERRASRRADREEKHASVDALTGLLNRRSFMDAVGNKLRKGDDFRIAIIDLDGFKAVNDTIGHAAGDTLLVAMAARLDRFLPHSTVGRLGGDEFAVLCPVGEVALDDMSAFERLVSLLCEPVGHDGSVVEVGASLGYYDTRSGFASSIAGIFERADQAMYQAKLQAGPAVVAFDFEMERRWQVRQLLICKVSQPDFENHLSLAYQLIWDTQANAPSAVEAFVRWDSPNIGRISAKEFIEVAHSSGRMLNVTSGIVRRAVAECRTWDWNCDLHLNITGRDLLTPGAMGRLAAITAEAGAPPHHIVWEITESSVENLEAAIPIMNAMRERGFRFALDDVGSGVASLSHLCRLPIDIMKIDVQLTHSAACDERCQAMVTTLLDFAVRTGMTFIAEGVESLDQVMEVARYGGRYMQGYFFDHPVSAPVANAMLEVPLTAQDEQWTRQSRAGRR